jgi:hypothetical protein
VTAVAFFALGVVISLAGRLIAVWIRQWRESTAREGQNRKRQERDEITEPTLAELLAETGWRINPNESDRELARKAIPMVLLCAIALLFLFARSAVGWALFGFIAGQLLASTLQTRLD